MSKYIITESELRSIIKEAIAEELNEGLGHALGSALLNTAKYAALGTIAPGALANKGIMKTNDILSGNDTIGGTLNDFFGNGSNGSFDKGRGKKSKSEKQRDRLMNTKSISYEYGRPETVPGFAGKTKLAQKSEIVPPNTKKGIDWGEFGEHYHDEGDRVWNRKFADVENSFIRNGSKHQNRYKRILVDWLKDRDRDYEIYIKSQK